MVVLIIRGTVIYSLFLGSILVIMYGTVLAGSSFDPVDTLNLGIIATIFWVGSLLYSVRKHLSKKIPGSLKFWLNFHMITGGIGVGLILIHSDFKFRALIPTIATLVMLLITFTGVIGWFLYNRACRELSKSKGGKESVLTEDEYYLLTLSTTSMKYWKPLHKYLTYVVVSLTVVHILTVYIFRGLY